MKSIKFSHIYTKMPIGMIRPSTAILLQVFVIDKENLHDRFIAYDTRYIENERDYYYELPKGKLLVLLLFSHGELWTTIRRWTPEKEKYYKSQMGSVFKLEVTK